MSFRLDAHKERILAVQSEVVRVGGFFLAGGTGLGLRLAHRLSEDIDWFTPRAFDARQVVRQLEALHERPTEIREQGPHTIRAYYGELETSFIRYTQVRAEPELVKVGTLRIPVADLGAAAAMKAAAVHDRGAKRDFIDIYAICRTPGWSIGRFIEHATALLPLRAAQLTRALTYFVDAESQPMPEGCTLSWAAVKRDITRGVRAWERDRGPGLER